MLKKTNSVKYAGFISFLFLYSTVSSQDLPMVAAFNTYSNKALSEKIFVHTDKEFYLAGELMWFKLYYVDGNTHTPLKFSQIAYVEILNEKNESVLQAKLSLKPGECNGSFYLPLSLNTGNYTLRAYTSWMKNFDAGYFFKKTITIVNTLKDSEPSIVKNDSARTVINFFPEGGNLVSGIQSKVGFEVKDKNGGVNNFNGYIISDKADTVASFTALKFGIGSFVFKPENGSTYRVAIVLSNGVVINKELPLIYKDGYIMQLREDESRQQVIITVRRKPMPGEQNVGQILLLAHTRQVLKIAEKAFITDSATFIIDKNKLGEGVSQFTVFSTNNKPVCERLFYIKPESQAWLNVETGLKEYNNRQKVEITLTASDNKWPFDLSASVFYIDSFQKADLTNIYDYIWLSSDLAGYTESPGYYFSDDPDVAKATDNLMLTHGWRRFKWNTIINDNNSFVKYLPEINGHLITGRVLDSRNGQPAADINTYLSISGKPFGFYSARSDKNGFVQYEVKNYYGNGLLIAQRAMDADSIYTVNIISPFAEKVSDNEAGPVRIKQDLKAQLLQRSIDMQLQNVYSGDSLRSLRDILFKDTLPFYGMPQRSYKLDDYKRFTTMEEVLREYVSEVGVGMRNGRPVLKIFDPQEHDFYKGYELVLLDGIPLKNANKIFSYDPLKIKKIDIVQTRYALGQSIFNGIASFSTYEGLFDGFDLDSGLIAIDYAGLQLQREFYSPVYETKEQAEKRIPDSRTTLFWKPDVITDAEGKATFYFYSSDVKGKYVIVLQGMNANGSFISGTTSFTVK